MVGKLKHATTTTRRDMVVSTLESTTSSLIVKCIRGVLVLTKMRDTSNSEHEARHDGEQGGANLEDRP